MTTLNAKLMEDKLKIGWTSEDFAQHLEISVEDFPTLLQRTFSSRASRSMLAKLDQNQKRKKKLIRKKVTPMEVELETLPETEEPISSSEQTLSDLEILRKKADVIQKEICEKEIHQNELFSQRRILYNSLKNKKEKLLQLQTLIDQHKTEVEEVVAKFADLSNQLSFLKAEISDQRRILEDIQSDIKSLEKVVIYVYNNGEIELENSEVEIPDTWTSLFPELIELDTVEALTVKQIKQLAKLIAFTRLLNDLSKKFEISFDNEEVSKAYSVLS